ncbi:MAG: carboxypeptidase-like regulatory domain-containing protein, partial [Bacteroidota bacterium]
MLMRILSSIKRILFLSLSLSIYIPMIAFGQATLKGTITDASSNETLIGVNVVIQGTSLGAATDIEGKFVIFGIPERAFDVKISCVGYEPLIQKIDFSTKQEVSRKFQLKPTVIEGEEVVVTAQMRGQLAAINQQITSNSIVNVVSEEKIQELPDANAAEAIGRLPGVALTRNGGEAAGVVLRGLSSKFSNITIDGVKIPATDPNSRDVDLSMLSQGALAGIELYKTLTPDQDADAIAGGINLVTRKAPSEMLLRADVKGSYNYLMKSANQYDASARYGERFFNDILGVRLEGNVEKKIRSQENVATSYNTTDNPSLPSYGTYNIEEYDNDYSIRASTRQFTNEMRKRSGMQAALDVNTPDSGSVKLTGVYAFTNRNYMTYERQYSGTWIYDYQNIDQNMVTRNGSLQGKNYLLGLTMDWNGSYAESKVTNPTNFRTIFYGSGNSNPANPIKENPEQFDAGANNDFTKVALDSMDTYKTENFDKELTGQFGLTKNVTILDMFTNELKVGIKYKEKSRWLDNTGMAWNTYQDAPFLDAQGHPIDFSGTPFAGTNSHVQLSRFVDMANVPTRNLLGLYILSPLIDAGTYQMFQDMVQNSKFTAQINYGTIGAMALSNYFITERISSAYFMDNVGIGNSIALEFGVRMEKERNDYLAHYGT